VSERVVIITGASSGIGAALARYLASRNDRVVVVARRRAVLEAVARDCGGRAHAVVADATRRTEVQKVVREALERFGQIDVLVNNVGQGITRMPSELTDKDIDDMVRVNVTSALYGMQEVLPHFKSRGTGQVINVSSLLGRMPYALARSAYNGAKHFLNALTANFRTEVQADHPEIHFSIVSPGPVQTEFGANALHGGVDSRTLPDAQSAEEVARVIADVMDTRRPDVYTRAGMQARVTSYYESLGEDP